jgi:hypothetical protein
MAIFEQGAFQQNQNDTPESIKRRRAMIRDAMMNYGSASNVGEGVGQLLNGIVTGVQMRGVDRAEQAGLASGQEAQSKIFDAMMGGARSTPAAMPTSAPTSSAPSSMSPYRDAIASIESKGSGDYAAVGPTHSKLGRALGRYQIMEANIPVWSKEVLGRPVTSDEFMANPQLQDQIFDGKFQSYVNKFGPEGAAQAWLGGPGGVGKLNRKDSLGTSIAEYGQRFTKALGGAAPQVASLDPSAGIAYAAPQAQSGADKVFSAIMPQTQQSAPQMPARGGSGLDVWQGRATQGTATDGTQLTRLPSGEIQRTNRFGVTERMSPEGGASAMVGSSMAARQPQMQPQQVAQAGPMQAPMPQAPMQPQQPQQGGVNLQAMLEAAQNPFTPEPVRKMALDFIQNEQMKQTPEYQADQQMKQLQLQKAQMEFEQLRNPGSRFENVGGRLVKINPDGTVNEAYAPPPEPIKEPAKPAEIQEYEYAKGQGFPGTFQDWKASQKGGMALQVDPATGQVTFQQGSNIKPMTEAQSKDTVYAVRAEGALPLLDSLDKELTSVQGNTLGQLPLVGNALKPEAFQKAEQASNEFLQALLRKDTGAAITEGEQVLYGNTYIPRMGDGPEVIEQKRQSRYRALQAMKAGMTPQAILAQEQALKKSGNEVMQPSATPQAAPQAARDVTTPPQGVDADTWKHMTPEERALWN